MKKTARLTLLFLLLVGCGQPQKDAQIQKSVDDLEKRIGDLEFKNANLTNQVNVLIEDVSDLKRSQ